MLWKSGTCYVNAIYYCFYWRKHAGSYSPKYFVFLTTWCFHVFLTNSLFPQNVCLFRSVIASSNVVTWRNGGHSFLLCHFVFSFQDCDYPLLSLTRAWWKSNPFVSAPPLMHPHADSKQLMFTKIELSSYSHIFNQSSIWVSRRSQMAWPLPGS